MTKWKQSGHFRKYHNTLCLWPQILHKHCFCFLSGTLQFPRETENNAYAKFLRRQTKSIMVFSKVAYCFYYHTDNYSNRAVFKWLSKVIMWLRLLRLVIGLKGLRQFFNQWEAKPKPIAPCTRDFSRASSELQVIARNCDWFIVLLAPVVIGRSNRFGFGFSTVIWKPLYTACWVSEQVLRRLT